MTENQTTIHNVNEQTQRQHSRILIVGSGLGGIGMGRQLLVDGETDFIIIERADSLGGTWRDNTYPGCACDVPSHLYSFSFHLNPEWSRVHAPQPEILRYVEEVARDTGVINHFQFGVELISANWDDASEQWCVETSRGVYTAQILITATGHLSDPKLPSVDGIETFKQIMFHSARWNHEVDLAGKRVGVVGTGASAVQIVPEVAKVASHLTVFQRSAPWIRPRSEHQYTVAERRMFTRAPETLQRLRSDMYWGAEQLFLEKRVVSQFMAVGAQTARDHLHSQVDDPELLRKLTPNYGFGCKRTLRTNAYYPTFNLPHVELTVSKIERATPTTLITEDGVEHDVDVLIFATGFEAADLPISHRIRGRGGKLLADHWENGPQAVAGITVHDYPNLFILNGPNSSVVASIIFMIECQASYVAGAIRYMKENALSWIEPTQEAENAFAADIDRRSVGTVWLEGNCDSWYVDERSGRLTALWPDFARRYLLENSQFNPDGYELATESELDLAQV